MERQHYIDALRVLAVLLLVVFHTSMVFHPPGFHVENAERSTFLGFANAFLYQWHMPLFMLLAGASTWFALRKRTPGQYVAERVKRILVPLSFGMLALIPPQVYLERLQKAQFSGSYLEFYPSVFTTGPYPGGNLSYHHLWFLLYLFVIALATLPLLTRLRRHGQVLDRIAALGSTATGLLFLFPVPLVSSQLALRWLWPHDTHFPPTDVANLVQLGILFVAGYLLMADPRLPDAVDRYWQRALGLGVVTAATLLWLGWRFADGPPGTIPWFLSYLVDVVLRYTNTWLWLVALLGLGRTYLNRPSPLLRRASVIAYPYYVWHQTIILLLAYPVVRLDAGIGTKWLLIAVPAAAITWLLSEAVRMTRPTRLLFGLS